MFVFIWVSLVFAAEATRTHCEDGYCVTFDDGVIMGEVGLCVIIRCSYTVNFLWLPRGIIWSKCERSRCADSEIIFNSASRNLSTGLKGRMSLLEHDIYLQNCSIIINDLTVSDSGLYQLSVDGVLSGNRSRHVYSARVKVIVGGLTQKPAVTVPTLAEGRKATLSCTAPGLCTGSNPKMQWLWRGREEDGPLISGSTSTSTIFYQTTTLTAVTQRHSSTLTFEPRAARHDGSEVTCVVSYRNSIRTEETVVLRVTSFPKILGSRCEVQSDVLTCTCTSDGFPLPTITWSLFEDHNEYSVITIVSNHTVTSTVTVTVKERISTVYCLSGNEDGEEQKMINVTVTLERPKGPAQDRRPQSVVIPWVITAISLVVGVLCVICMLIQRSQRRRRRKPNLEDRTYVSLKKSDTSPEYDVIGQPVK